LYAIELHPLYIYTKFVFYPRGINYHDEVYMIPHYVIMFVSDLRQVGGFLRFPPLNKTDR